MAGGRDRDGLDLDAILEASADGAPVPDALMARVLADAARVQAGFDPSRVPPRPAMRPRLRAGGRGLAGRLVHAAGGGGACVGLAMATLAGLWVGLTQPAALSPVSQHLWSATAGESVELIPSIDEVLSYAEG